MQFREIVIHEVTNCIVDAVAEFQWNTWWLVSNMK